MTDTNAVGAPGVFSSGPVRLLKASRSVFSATNVVHSCLGTLVAARLVTTRAYDEQRISRATDMYQGFNGGACIRKPGEKDYSVHRRAGPAMIHCALLALLTLRQVAVAAAIDHEGRGTADGSARSVRDYLPSKQSRRNRVFSKGGEERAHDEFNDNEAFLGPSLLQGKEPLPTDPDGYIHLAVCDGGIYLDSGGTPQGSVSVSESRNCWQLCHFLEDKYYDVCKSEDSPADCFKQQFVQDATVPQLYKSACIYEDPKQASPLFAQTKPNSNSCLQSGMELWHRTRSWVGLVLHKPRECTYVIWEPVATGWFVPNPYIDENTSYWASAVRLTRFTEYYVISRDVDIVSEEEADSFSLSEIESSIVPASYWDAKQRKGAWDVVAKFTAPEQHHWFEKLTLDDAGVNSAANICLFEISRGAGMENKFGMVPGTDECSGKIGVLRVAALSAAPAAASVDRETGFNLCVARRWVETIRDEEGHSISRVEVMQRVMLESNCASALSPFGQKVLNPKTAGEWEQHFVALLYPLTKGIPGVQDSANCPWEKSIQYGLKCFAAVEVDSSAHLATFPESQTACRRFALNTGAPTNFSRLAVIQNDQDFSLLSFISPPGSTAWIGLYQQSQVQLPNITLEAIKLRIPETPCPDDILAPVGKSFSRMSTLKTMCEASGSLIDQPPWESTWPANDGDVSTTKGWDIPWCAGHPQVAAEDRYVDCAALRKEKDGSSCVYSAACDSHLASFCSFPVYYPPGVIGHSSEHGSLHLSPRVSCTRAACVLRFKLVAKKDIFSERTLNFLGVPLPHEASIAIKSTCMSSKSMIGPYTLEEEVSLTSLESFKTLKPGIYDICYCTWLPHAKLQGDGVHCTASREYRQLIATLVLQDDPKTVVRGAVEIPTAVLRPSSASAFAIDSGRSNMLGDKIVSCAWLAAMPLEACTFYLKPAGSAAAGSSTRFTLNFIPLNPEANDERVCQGRFDARVKGDISVDSVVSVPLTHPTATFYAVCEGSGEHIGSLFFPESVVLPKRPEATMQLTFPSFSVKRPVVALTIRNRYVEGVGKISYVVVQPTKDEQDANCSWDVVQKSEDMQEYRDATDFEDGSVRFVLKPNVGFAKICYIVEENTAGSDGAGYSGYIDFLPPASKMSLLATAESRCFAQPDTTPCVIHAAPEPLPEYDNPHNLAAFFPPSMRLYAIPEGTGCPTNVNDPLYTDFEGDQNDVSAVQRASSVPLSETAELGNKITFELPPALKPWLKKQRTAILCWLRSPSSDSLTCPSGLPCVETVGRLYWVEVDTSDTENNKISCSEEDVGGCLIPVRGVNLNLFETLVGRLVALDSCQNPQVEATSLRVYGKYFNNPLKGEEAFGFREAPHVVSPSDTTGRGESEVPGADVYTRIDYMDFSRVLSAELSSVFNSTTINFHSGFRKEPIMQELCFDGARAYSLALATPQYQHVGYLVFKLSLISAVLKVTESADNAGRMYEVTVAVKDSNKQPLESRSVVYTKVPSLDQMKETPCDYIVDRTTALIHEKNPAEVNVIDDSYTQAVYRHTRANQPVAFCWSFSVSSSSGESTAWQNALLGYSVGPSLPLVESGTSFCSLESISRGCSFTLLPDPKPKTFAGGYFTETSVYLSEAGVVAMLKDPSASCPASFATSVFSEQADAAYVLQKNIISPTKQELFVPVEGLNTLGRTGKAGLCYAVRDCGPVSHGVECTKDLGLLKWLGPVEQPAGWLVVCERLELSGCMITISGYGFDMLDYSSPLLAVKRSCATPAILQLGSLHKKPSPESQESQNLAQVKTATPQRSESWDALPESGTSTSVEFAVAYMPASVGELCWDIRRQLGGTGSASDVNHTYFLGNILFLPLPLVQASELKTDPTKGMKLHMRINVLMELSNIMPLHTSATVEHVDDHYLYQVVENSKACADSTAKELRLSFVQASSRVVTVPSRIQGAPFSIFESGDSAEEASSGVVETVDLDYEVSPWADPTQLCWRSIFHDGGGRKIHDYVTYVESIAGASPPELDGSAVNHPDPQVALCNQVDDPADCTVTIKPQASASSRLLPSSSQVFLLRGDTSCPTEVDDELFTTAEEGAHGSIAESAVSVKMLMREWNSQQGTLTFAYPIADKTWVSISGVASICWTYGSKNDCPVVDHRPCVLTLGKMYWRGPVLGVKPLETVCDSASGCEVEVEGMNLHKLDHSYSRVALLNKCGEPGGRGLLEVTTYPDGYSQLRSSVSPPPNFFEPENQVGQGRFFVYGDRVVELACEEGTTVVVVEAIWQMEKAAPGAMCQGIDVLTRLTHWCKGKNLCVLRPYVAAEDLSVTMSIPERENLALPNPCSTGENPVLSGLYNCKSDSDSVVALVEERTQTASKFRFGGTWSNTMQHMTFAVSPTGPGQYRICWNPNEELVLKPEAYVADLGLVQILPAAGVFDIRKSPSSAVDNAVLEVYVASMLDEEAAKGTFIYVVPPSDARECKWDSGQVLSRVGSYAARSADVSILMYALSAPESEMVLCWNWMEETLVDATGLKQQNRLGAVPGATNPELLAWGELLCGGATDTTCQVSLHPAPVESVYFVSASSNAEKPAVPGRRSFKNLNPFFQGKYSIFMVGGKDSCPTDPADPVYTDIGENTSSLQLRRTRSTATDVVVELGGADKQWLAAQLDGHLCWVNDGACGSLGQKPCVAEVSIVSWIAVCSNALSDDAGPVPSEWEPNPLRVFCKKHTPCEVAVRGRNLFLMDLRTSRVAILESCGATGGPGIAPEKLKSVSPTLTASTVSSTLPTSPASPQHVETTALAFLSEPPTRASFGSCSFNTACKYHSLTDQLGSALSTLEAEARAVPNLSKTEVMLVVTTITEARNYLVCWNPNTRASSDLSEFSVPIGNVEYYGFRTIQAFCFSGSTCALHLPAMGLDMADVQVALKTVDCSDLTLSRDFGDGILHRNANDDFELAGRIPEGPSSLKTYHLCWCDTRFVQECAPTDYADQIGTLTVRVMPHINAICSFVEDSCRITAPLLLFEEDPHGRLSLVEDTTETRNCEGEGNRFDPSLEFHNKQVQFAVKVPENRPEEPAPTTILLICWNHRTDKNRAETDIEETRFSSTPALLGTITFAGPLKLEYQRKDMVAPVGIRLRVELTVVGFGRLVDTIVDSSMPESLLHQQWRQLLVVPRDTCGHSDYVHRLQLTRVAAGERFQTAVYEDTLVMGIPPNGVDRLDACWCTNHYSCSADVHYAVKVAELDVVSPQQRVYAACSYDSRCSFEFAIVQNEDSYGLDSGLIVADPGCTATGVELPGMGVLIRKTNINDDKMDGEAVQNSILRQREKWEFSSSVARSAIFPRQEKEYSFSICYCAVASTGCEPSELVEVGTLVVYDVWLGTFMINPSQSLDLLLTSPPFTGVNGQMYISEGDGLPEREIGSQTPTDRLHFVVELDLLLDEEFPPSTVSVLYCENDDPAYCSSGEPERIKLAEVHMQGSAERNWIGWCALGSRCEFSLKFFKSNKSERIAMLASCVEPHSFFEYGVSNVGVISDTTTSASRMMFSWEKELPDNGLSSYEACWCSGTTNADCTSVDDFRTQIGKVMVTGVKRSQSGECHVGTVCTAGSLAGYNLRETLSLKILADGCGASGKEIHTLPRKGLFVPFDVKETTASFTLEQKLLAVESSFARLCQCARLDGECTKADEYTWDVGQYSFVGPSEVVVDSGAVTGLHFGFKLSYTGAIDITRDFFKLDIHKDCTHTTPSDPLLPLDGWLPLTSDGYVDVSRYSFLLKGHVYYVCYCRASESVIFAGQINNPFYQEDVRPDENRCNVASAYKTLVGVFVVTGPHEVDTVYTCVSGAHCQFDIMSTFSGTVESERCIQASVVEVKQVSCDDGIALASGTVQKWTPETELVVDYENITVKIVRQTFTFPAQLTLAAGIYKVCWRAYEDLGNSLEMGLLQMKGPTASEVVREVWSGREFSLSVGYAGEDDSSVLRQSRLRVVPYPESVKPPQSVNCTTQPWSLGESAAFRYLQLNRPPDNIQNYTESFRRAIWDDAIIVVDAKSPEFAPGSFFAVCFCDGNAADCTLESSYFVQVATLQVVGTPLLHGCSEDTVGIKQEVCVTHRERRGSKVNPLAKSWPLRQNAKLRYMPVAGPAPSNLSYPVQLGRSVRYVVEGRRLPSENYIMLLPPRDPATDQPYSCGQAGTEKLFPVTVAVIETDQDPNKALFKDVVVSAPSPTVTVCWCGGPGCSVGSQFRVEIGTIAVEFPQMEKATTIPEGVFSIVLMGSSVRFMDRVTVVDPEKICGQEGTEKMDPRLVTVPQNSSVTNLDDLGKGQIIQGLPPVGGKSRWLWSSWPIQATQEASKSLKVCFCSSSEGACVGQYRFNAWVGSVTVLGPFRGSLRLYSMPHLMQQIELTGNSLSLSNKLKYFVNPRSTDSSSGDLRRLCSQIPDTEATIVIPDWVDDDGTAERFAVSMSPGYRYIICWSFGHSLPGTAEKPRDEEASSTVVGSAGDSRAAAEPESELDRELMQPSATNTNDPSEPSFASLVPPDAETATSLTTPASRLNWNFLADFLPTGLRPGQIFTAVVNMEDQLVIRGSPNTTDVYIAFVGEEGRGRDCDELGKQPIYVLETSEVTEQHILFPSPKFRSTGLYPVCVLNVDRDHFYDVGVIKVEEYYWKSVYDVLARNRLIMFPCYSTDEKDTSGKDKGRLYMPDGMGAWRATLRSIETEQAKSIPILKFERGEEGWIDPHAHGLRSIVACATDHQQAVYLLGPSKLVVMPPPSAAGVNLASPTVAARNHGLPTPIDITAKYPYIFISDYQSPMILILSANDPDFRWRLFPTNPVLLFAAGIQVLEVEDGSIALAVADLINHLVGLIHLDTETMHTGEQGEVVGKPWNSYFGRPKVALHNAQGLSYPFTLGRYIPTSSAAVDVAGQTSTLLMVGELVSERIVFLEPRLNSLQFYRQILIPERLMLTGVHTVEDSLFLALRDWFKDVDQGDSNSYISIMNLSDLVDSPYFSYPDFRTKVQSGLRYSFTPVVSGPPIQFFKENTENSNMAEMGLQLNPKTGEISGLISHTGKFQVSVIGGDLLGTYTWTLSGEAGCRAGDYYNTEHATCEPCPIGTFRDQEADLQHCESHKPHSSTLSVGSTQLSQCQCIAGYEIGTLGACTPCPAGTYKATVSDSNCTGKCPANMRSSVVGAGSEEELHCTCESGYFMEADTCEPCPDGSYCLGDLSPPVKCPENRTTSSRAANSEDQCMCMAGFTLEGGECVMCSRLTYKATVGNEPCTPCPQPARLADTTPVLASTKREVVEYTPHPGATHSQDCRLCASGYFFESASGGCVPCSKNYFCPGRDLGPTSCAENSLTVHEGAETPFACKCPKGYGRISERNPVDLTIVCVECPRNTFQHIDGADTECIPCPLATVTKTTKSTTFTACVASPGYFYPERLEQILSGISPVTESSTAEDDDLENAAAPVVGQSERSGEPIDFSTIRLAEAKYEAMTDELSSVPRVCLPGRTLVERSSPEIKMQSYTETLESCIEACARNVYCTSLTFRRGHPADPSFATVVANYTGVYITSRWPCELHFYGKELTKDELEVLRNLQQTSTEEGVTSCVVHRAKEDMLWRRVVYQECPMNAYCPGDKEAQIYECPSSSVTLVPRASSVDQCSCIPGYRSVAGQCEPCRIGTYKNTTSNMGCTECPSSFTTAAVASISAYDCACLPGLYMKMLDDVDDEAESPRYTGDAINDDEGVEEGHKALPDGKADVQSNRSVLGGGNAETEMEEDDEKKSGAEPDDANTEGEANGSSTVESARATNGKVGNSQNNSDRSELVQPAQRLGGVPVLSDDLPASDVSLRSLLETVKTEQRIHKETRTATPLPHRASVTDSENFGNKISSAVELHGNLLIRADRGEVATLDTKHAAGRGGLTGVIFMAEGGSSLLDWAKPKWLEEDMRQKLERIVKLHQCVACYKQMYCPGLWLDPPLNHTHMPPQLCPEGSSVPSSTVIADSIEKCLCLPGYSYVGGGGDNKSLTTSCNKCAPGTYKELQENSPCAGRCMKDAETFEGAVSKIQCFCKVGKYAVESTGTDALLTCHECVQGGVCPGGFKKRVREGIEADHSFVDITIHDHQVPFPSKGFFAVYKELAKTVWDPSLVPMSSNFTGDTFVAAADMEPDLFRRSMVDDVNLLDMSRVPQVKSMLRAPDSALPLGGNHVPQSNVYGARRLPVTRSHVGKHTGMLQVEVKTAVKITKTPANLRYERIPDIHPCFEDRRCDGGPHNTCSRGSAGYLCSACEPGYSTPWYRSMCIACSPLWAEMLIFLCIRLAACLVFWLLASLSVVAAQQRELVHPVLLRIFLSNYFLFSIFGLMPETSVSSLFEWAPLYRAFFFTGYFSSHAYLKLACVTSALGLSLEYRHTWYIQHLFQILVPAFDALFLTLVSMVAVSVYKIVFTRRIQRIQAVLTHARKTRGGEFWTDCTIRKVENDRCLGMFRYLTSVSVFSWTGLKTLLADLIPAYTVIWFWHYPALIIQCSELISCVATRYKSESPIFVLSAMPVQTCKLDNILFLGGFILGMSGILLWGVGTIILLVVYIHHTQDAEPIYERFRRSFLSSGYQVQYRAWEAVLTVRKGVLALIMAVNIHLNSAGAQEVFRSSANLVVSVVYVMMQLIMEPYDKRSHNLANRVEFYGLLAHVFNGVIIQGSYYFDAFKYVGPIPIVVTSIFYLYVIWNLFVEWGRVVIMRPYLARVPSLWRYYNRVTRSLARLYAAGNAKIYYNYITKDMVVEAATKLRVFHIRRLLRRTGYESTYRKINYENRLYFVAALTDSLSQLVIAWCQFTIPGDWLDFTIRYAFCYCFWQRHHGSIKFRVPLDSQEFDSIKPDLFSDWYHKPEVSENVDVGADMFEGKGYVCSQAEEELLQLMLDDDVYDDSPITLMELYVAVQSMRYIPQVQLRRLHYWYRERIANASTTLIPETRRENEELKIEIERLNETLQQMTGAQGVSGAPSFSLLDFFFTVEMVQQAHMEVVRLQEQLDKVTEEITRDRVAQAMATHLLIGLKQDEEEHAREEAAEATDKVLSLPVALRKEAAREPRQPVTGEVALSAQREENRTDYLLEKKVRTTPHDKKGLGRRKLKLPERRLDRAETRHTLQRSFLTRRTLSGPGDRQGGPSTLRRPGSREGVPSRRIVVGGETRQRSLSPLQTAKPREKSIRLTEATTSGFQAGDDGPPFSSVGGEASVEMRRRTLTRRHLEGRRSSVLSLPGEHETKRTIRLGSEIGVESKRTLSLSTRRSSGDLSGTAEAYSEDTTRKPPSAARSGSFADRRFVRGNDFQDRARGEKRKLSPVHIEGQTFERPRMSSQGKVFDAEPETAKTGAGEPVSRGQNVELPRGEAHSAAELTSSSSREIPTRRTVARVAAEAASPPHGKVSLSSTESQRRRVASWRLESPVLSEREARASAESPGPTVGRDRRRSPTTAGPVSAGVQRGDASDEGASPAARTDGRATRSQAEVSERREPKDGSRSSS